MAGESGSVAAGAFYPGTPHGAKAFHPAEKPLVTICGRWYAQLAQAPAQMVHGHRRVEVQVCVHAQDHLDLGLRSLGTESHRHVRAAPFDVAVTLHSVSRRERTIL